MCTEERLRMIAKYVDDMATACLLRPICHERPVGHAAAKSHLKLGGTTDGSERDGKLCLIQKINRWRGLFGSTFL